MNNLLSRDHPNVFTNLQMSAPRDVRFYITNFSCGNVTGLRVLARRGKELGGDIWRVTLHGVCQGTILRPSLTITRLFQKW